MPRHDCGNGADAKVAAKRQGQRWKENQIVDAISRRCRSQPAAHIAPSAATSAGLALLHRAYAATITDRPGESDATGKDAERREKP
ncbi:hypothetical protein MINTM008_01460 [Mycobacterium intracellulare]|nr:hypothetical protein MINTM006_01440 [Mycobacterium intracellulare]BCO70811.1 hypothetical protein MINTM008_01460 [Mycobacterium intracellulare]BCO76363.1 hypothetical protein MINTM009_01450 [Mycobacterium intracellulare]BCP18356.1 hypothetical protein MINTM023_01450 [Mycobacterium intracellulare]BCP23793.1 hypothetical protein MINTM025_01490 [Mycobacterium intracellulare]